MNVIEFESTRSPLGSICPSAWFPFLPFPVGMLGESPDAGQGDPLGTVSVQLDVMVTSSMAS